MTSKPVFISILAVLIWGGVFMILKSRTRSGEDKTQGYLDWIRTTLEQMFIVLKPKTISRTILALTLAGAAIGFVLPGKVSQIDQLLTLEEAIGLNEKGLYIEASLVLDSIKSLPSPLVHNELGVAFLGQGNFDKAERAFQQAIRLLPHYGKAHQNLALVYTITGRGTEASFEESRALESEKFDVDNLRVINLSDNPMEQLNIRLFLACILGFLGYRLFGMIVRFLQKRRQRLFDEQLADGLVMIANGLRAGLSLVQAVEMVAREAKKPLNQEFDLILREQRLGSSLPDAFSHLTQRMPGKDTHIMVNAVLILLESGGNLPDRFESLSKSIQERKRILKKIKTLTADGETQAWILSVLPIVLALVMNFLNEEVFALLYTTALGWLIVCLMVLMEILGIFFMMKAVKVNI